MIFDRVLGDIALMTGADAGVSDDGERFVEELFPPRYRHMYDEAFHRKLISREGKLRPGQSDGRLAGLHGGRTRALGGSRSSGSLLEMSGISAEASKVGAATVQHLSWETQTAWAAGQGSAVTIRVKCYEQAGGLHGELIDYAAVASIWVAPALGIDVYAQVRDQVRAPIVIRPTP